MGAGCYLPAIPEVSLDPLNQVQVLAPVRGPAVFTL